MGPYMPWPDTAAPFAGGARTLARAASPDLWDHPQEDLHPPWLPSKPLDEFVQREVVQPFCNRCPGPGILG
jgi:hypothetical protein